jgi:hypothetical protein
MGGHSHDCIPLLEAAASGTPPMGVFRRRMTRAVGGVLIPMLIACRKLAMHHFGGGKKGVDHGRIAIVRGCRFELCANGIGNFKWLLPY